MTVTGRSLKQLLYVGVALLATGLIFGVIFEGGPRGLFEITLGVGFGLYAAMLWLVHTSEREETEAEDPALWDAEARS